eukprot:gene5317-5986_t
MSIIGFVNLVLVALFCTSFVKIVANQSTVQSDEIHSTNTELSYCYGKNRKPLTLISTLDGRFMALDSYTGKLEWSLSDVSEPLLSSSLSSIKNAQGRPKLVPSLDGGLYQIKEDKIETVPLSAELLLGKCQTLSDGSHIIGGKGTKSYGIDSDTGKLIYKCSIQGCNPVSKGPKLSDKDVFVLRRTQQTIRAVDQRSGEERWNFSVGSFDVSFMEAVNNRPSNCDMYADRPRLQLRMNIADGHVKAIHTDPSSHGKSQWAFKFDAPIAAVWSFDRNKLQTVDILRHGILDDASNEKFTEDAILYMGMHDGQMYAQAFETLPNSIPGGPSVVIEPDAGLHEVAVFDQPYVGTWRPYISSSPSRTASLMNSNGLSVLNQLDYPYDNGFCMIALKRITSLKQLNGKPKASESAANSTKNKSDDEEEYASYYSVSITERWKEIILLAVLISVVLQLTIFRFIRRKFLRDVNAKLQSRHEQIERVKSQVSNVSTSTETVKPSEGIDLQRISSIEEFSSRYLSDFDHLECIGKGGFGVVFKARNKIDGCEYAVKRIYIPNCEEAREKVTREVKALAKLDYPGIVRFYYSWWETPPKGWQDQTDRQNLMKNIAEGPTMGLSKEWYVHIQSDEEDDTFDRSDLSSGSGITIKRNRNPSSCMSHNSRGSTKSIGDDPLGKKLSNVAGIDNNDLMNIDLKENDDVFFEEEDHVASSDDDSFNVEFKDSSSSETDNKESDSGCEAVDESSSKLLDESLSGLHYSQKSQQTDFSSSLKGDYLSKNENMNARVLKTRLSTKLVGRCCCKSESCLTAPPVYLYIQMQLCMSSTLKDWLNVNIRLRQRNYIMGIFRQILNAVEYCHNQGMMHRDLKPSNILFASDGTIKIGDFGLVTAIRMPSHGQANTTSPISESHTGNVGTQLYMSPEQVNGKTYNHKVDIYSLGLILFELLQPFSTQMERIKTLLEVKQSRFPVEFEESYKPEAQVLRCLLREDPSQRPEANEFKSSKLYREMLKSDS